MIKFLIVVFVLLSLIPLSPYGYSKYLLWDVSNPADDDSKINLILDSVTPKAIVAIVRQAQEINSGAVIVDVRNEAQYSKKHIKGAILIPEPELDSQIGEMFPDKKKTIYFYSENNANSSAATRLARDMGYDNSFSLDGGLRAWEKAGYGIEEYLY